jgi:hypothetical protein
MKPQNHVLVVGAPQTGKASLVARLSPDGFVWPLSTKYYTADVYLTVRRGPPGESEADGPLPELQGVVAVFDPSKPSSFSHAQAWLTWMEQGPGIPEIAICLANTRTDGHDLTMHREWCVERGVELVTGAVVEAGSAATPAAAQPQEEKEGVARVIEAFECHMWPSLTRLGSDKKENSARPKPEDPFTNVGYEPMLDDDELADVAVAAEPPAGEGEAGKEGVDLRGIEEEGLVKMMEAALKGIQGIGDGEEDEAEKNDAEFARIMDQVLFLRQKSQSLSDEKRRELAAQVALSMAAMLGEEGLGDD